jgi:hypothetical protein
MVTRVLAVLSVIGLIALSGCGESTPAPSGGGSTQAPAKPAETPKKDKKAGAAAAAYDPVKATGSIKGVASFDGEAPKAKQIDISSSKDCSALHKEPMLKEDIVVKDGKVQNVVVYVKAVDGANPEDKWTFTTPTSSKSIDQKGCRYEPHIVTVEIDQPLDITTSDDFPHNIHKLAKDNPEFNESQQKAGMKTTKKFANAEMACEIVCNIHNWMKAYLFVFPHPFYAVTKEDGSFEIKGLPAGEYEVVAWHESDKVAAPVSQKIKVGDGESKEANFSFKAK